MISLFVAVGGYVGAFLILLAYFMVSHKRWNSRSEVFQLTNAIGAFLLAVNALYMQAYPFLILNTVWLAVALHALFKSGNDKSLAGSSKT